MRKIEKISFEQFKKDIKDDSVLYESYSIPVRKTKQSAGYDFPVVEGFTLEPGASKKIPLGFKVSMNEGEVFFLVIRSSVGFKYNVRLTNQIGVIDQDYYNNETNEGHMYISIQNEGKKAFTIEKGACICQGIFSKYYTVDHEEKIETHRTAGIGSTNKGDDTSA